MKSCETSISEIADRNYSVFLTGDMEKSVHDWYNVKRANVLVKNRAEASQA